MKTKEIFTPKKKTQQTRCKTALSISGITCTKQHVSRTITYPNQRFNVRHYNLEITSLHLEANK